MWIRQSLSVGTAAGYFGCSAPWVFLAAVHSRSSRRRSRAGPLVLTAASDHAEDIAATDEDRHNLVVIAAVLDGLSRTDREVIQLCVIDGLSASQVAEITREPASSIRSRLSRALTRARHAYERAAADDHPRRTGAVLGSIQ